jgi:uncharacterized membrane protein YvlD (DUF360 family)
LNWKSWIWRTVIAFVTLFLGGYLIPGLSVFTVPHLLIVSILLAYLATAGENVLLTDTRQKKSILLFVVSAVTIYLYALVLVRERPPAVSALLMAALISGVDYVLQSREDYAVTSGDEGAVQE